MVQVSVHMITWKSDSHFNVNNSWDIVAVSQTTKFMGPTWGPSGSCRPQMDPMMAPWTLLSEVTLLMTMTWTQLRLTHWGRVTHICVSNLTIIASDDGLSPVRHQAIIWTNAVTLLIGSLGTNFSEIVIEIYRFSFKKLHLKMSSAKWRPTCLGLNVLSGSLGGIIAVQAVQLPSTANWFKDYRHYCTTLKLRDFSFVDTVLNHHRNVYL